MLVPLKVSWHCRETFEGTTKAFATMTTLKVDTKTSGIDNDNAADSYPEIRDIDSLRIRGIQPPTAPSVNT